MALTINPVELNNNLKHVIKPATINEHNLSLNELDHNLKHAIKTRTTKPKINTYEQSTRASTTQETTTSEDEATPINPTQY